MATRLNEEKRFRAVVPALMEVHEVTWRDNHLPGDHHEQHLWCSCGHVEGPNLRVGLIREFGHFSAVGARSAVNLT
jgi:hypothetical protein